MTLVMHGLGLSGGGQARVAVRGDGTCAMIFGQPDNGCLVRMHSRCLYGDVFQSIECDCGGQLRRSIEMIRRARSGVILYLEQEGRGAGLLGKAMAYQYSEKNRADTYAAYRALHLPLDRRSYAAAAKVLRELGLDKVELLTNNPDKVTGLESNGIEVKRRPLAVPVAPAAVEYLEAKKREGGHLLGKIRTTERIPRWKVIFGGIRRNPYPEQLLVDPVTDGELSSAR